jgi:hypothetical protein
LLVRAAHHDLERIVGQRPMQRLGLILEAPFAASRVEFQRTLCQPADELDIRVSPAIGRPCSIVERYQFRSAIRTSSS